MKTHYIAYPPPLFQNFSTPPPSMSCPTLTPTAHSVVLFLWLNGWSHYIWCAILLKDIIDVHMSSLMTLMHVLCNKASSLQRSDTGCGFSLVLWFDLLLTHKHRHTHKDTQHTQGSVDGHTHINIYLHQLLCAHSNYLYYIE